MMNHVLVLARRGRKAREELVRFRAPVYERRADYALGKVKRWKQVAAIRTIRKRCVAGEAPPLATIEFGISATKRNLIRDNNSSQHFDRRGDEPLKDYCVRASPWRIHSQDLSRAVNCRIHPITTAARMTSTAISERPSTGSNLYNDIVLSPDQEADANGISKNRDSECGRVRQFAGVAGKKRRDGYVTWRFAVLASTQSVARRSAPPVETGSPNS